MCRWNSMALSLLGCSRRSSSATSFPTMSNDGSDRRLRSKPISAADVAWSTSPFRARIVALVSSASDSRMGEMTSPPGVVLVEATACAIAMASESSPTAR